MDAFAGLRFRTRENFGTGLLKASAKTSIAFASVSRRCFSSVALTPQNVVGPKRRVLVVDDDESIRSLVACFLEQLGYEVTVASNPEEALLAADAIQFDIVVSDALMPKMDGREMCRRLKQSQGEKIKTILITPLYTANRCRVEARHLFRIDEYLSKPLQLPKLKSALHRLALHQTVQIRARRAVFIRGGASAEVAKRLPFR